MLRTLLRGLAMAALLVSAAFGQSNEPRLIIVSIDGLVPSTLDVAERDGWKIPNLKEMRAGGAASEGLVGVFPTVTYPSHTSMVTGVLPAEHGIYGNGLFDPDNTLQGAWFYYADMIRVPALWDVAHQAGIRSGAVSWPVTVGAKIDYNFPEHQQPNNLDRLYMNRTLNTPPGLFREFEKQYGEVKLGARIDDHFRAAQALFILKRHQPRLMLVHLIDVDHDQHGYGVGSPEARHALEVSDEAIGQLRQAVRELGFEANTRWLIVSDHGFWPVTHAFHAKAMLQSLGLGAPAGKPAEWRVAAYANGGSIAFISKDPNDREAQQQVLEALGALATQSRWGIDKVLNRAELDRYQGYPTAFAAVSLASGFTSGNNTEGAWVTPTATRGMHGYLPGPVELDCTFLAFGPGIAPAKLPRGQLIDVAPTAAALLNLKMPTAKGKNLLAR